MNAQGANSELALSDVNDHQRSRHASGQSSAIIIVFYRAERNQVSFVKSNQTAVPRCILVKHNDLKK